MLRIYHSLRVCLSKLESAPSSFFDVHASWTCFTVSEKTPTFMPHICWSHGSLCGVMMCNRQRAQSAEFTVVARKRAKGGQTRYLPRSMAQLTVRRMRCDINTPPFGYDSSKVPSLGIPRWFCLAFSKYTSGTHNFGGFPASTV